MGTNQTPGMNAKKMTKDERRSIAREKARLLREQEEKRAKRNRLLVIFAIVAVLAIVAVVIVKIVESGKNTDTGSYSGKARSAKLQNVQADYGIAVGKNWEALAKPAEALPKVGIFADLMCPHCVTLERDSMKAYEKYIPEGKVTVVQYPVQIMNTEYSRLGTAALYYVATYAPQQYGKFHAKLFDRAYQVAIERSAKIPSPAEIADIAKSVGVPEDVVNDLPASIVSADWQKNVTEATQKFRDAGWEGTPTVTINGKETKEWANGGLGTVFENVTKN